LARIGGADSSHRGVLRPSPPAPGLIYQTAICSHRSAKYLSSNYSITGLLVRSSSHNSAIFAPAPAIIHSARAWWVARPGLVSLAISVDHTHTTQTGPLVSTELSTVWTRSIRDTVGLAKHQRRVSSVAANNLGIKSITARVNNGDGLSRHVTSADAACSTRTMFSWSTLCFFLLLITIIRLPCIIMSEQD